MVGAVGNAGKSPGWLERLPLRQLLLMLSVLLIPLVLLACGDADSADAAPEASLELTSPPEGPTESPSTPPAEVASASVEPGPEPSRKMTLAAVGDVLFGRYSLDKRYKRIPLADRPFADLASILGRVDVAMANLESPVGEEPTELYVTTNQRGRADSPWSLTFRASPQDMGVLAEAGFDVLSLANNHARDLGRAAVASSRRHVEAAGLTAIGVGASLEEAQSPAIIEANGVVLAIIARTVWLKGLSAETAEGAVALSSNRGLGTHLSAEIERVKRVTGADFVAVSLHWGREYELEPDSSQRRVARRLIDAGASLVIGHHPHVVQSFERYHGGVIAYSLGNALFDSGGIERRRSVVLEVVLDASGARPVARSPVLHPVLIHSHTRSPLLARRGGYRAWRRDLAARAPGFAIAPEPAFSAVETSLP